MNKFSAVRGATLASLIAVAVLGFGSATHAASTVYSFTIRGIVTDVDQTEGTIKMDVAKVDGKGKSDLQDDNAQFNVKNITTVKVVNGKDKRVTWRNLAIGQEVGMKGVKKNDDTYNATFMRINERVFSVVGTMNDYDKDAETMKIGILNSTYKPSTYKNSEITMTFHNTDATFYEKTTKTKKKTDEVSNDGQRVKLIGVITGKNTWEIKSFIDHYKGTK